ncbi:uncharacterized protein LOC111618382 [Centruroides sculpturatus]|uniref:uncharacterized protein LOC111618382 n=1 Tax=Centruroides sculpturatus TaxID=218467 RepID=UPI000C6D0832|nr:uncharacterized protein LOC111618382 [Centruroides sculpturatus]
MERKGNEKESETSVLGRVKKPDAKEVYKDCTKLTEELKQQGFQISHSGVYIRLLPKGNLSNERKWKHCSSIAFSHGLNMECLDTMSEFNSIMKTPQVPLNSVKLPGIYSIPLRDHRFDREMVYIGSTRRSLGNRIKEHKTDIQHNRTTMALSTYVTDQDIMADFDASHIILTTTHPEHLKWLEAMEIFRAGRNTTCINFKEEIVLSTAWQILLD